MNVSSTQQTIGIFQIPTSGKKQKWGQCSGAREYYIKRNREIINRQNKRDTAIWGGISFYIQEKTIIAILKAIIIVFTNIK